MPKDAVAFEYEAGPLSVLPKDPIAFLCIITLSAENVNPFFRKNIKNFWT